MTQTDPHTTEHTRAEPEPWTLAVPREQAFINREVSWLRFNERVLHEALDERTPLLERAAFLAIFNSNLDEYFQKRVGYLKRQAELSQGRRGPDGLSATDQLKMIREMVVPMLKKQAEGYQQHIRPALAEHGIELLHWDQLTDAERKEAEQHFLYAHRVVVIAVNELIPQ